MIGWQEFGVLLACALVIYLLGLRHGLKSDEDLGEAVLARLLPGPRHSLVESDVALGMIVARFQGAGSLRFPDIRIHEVAGEDLNAMSVPGGAVLLTGAFCEGMVQGLFTVDELAAVIAHEVGHAELSHHRKRIRKKARAEVVDFLASRLWKRRVSGTGALLKGFFTHGDEFEADQFALRLLRDSGYDPNALASVLEKLSGPDLPGAIAWFTDHPPVRERLERIRRFGPNR